MKQSQLRLVITSLCFLRLEEELHATQQPETFPRKWLWTLLLLRPAGLSPPKEQKQLSLSSVRAMSDQNRWRVMGWTDDLKSFSAQNCRASPQTGSFGWKAGSGSYWPTAMPVNSHLLQHIAVCGGEQLAGLYKALALLSGKPGMRLNTVVLIRLRLAHWTSRQALRVAFVCQCGSCFIYGPSRCVGTR